MKQKIPNLKLIIQCALVCLGVYFLLYISQVNRSSTQFMEGEVYLTTLASQDVGEVSDLVASANLKMLLANASSLEEEYRIRFHSAVVVGDSIAEAFDEYDILTASNVVAKRGMRTDNCEEDIDRVIALAPKQVFLSYGMNDLEYCRGDAECFSSQYQNVLEKLQRELPNTTLYVSGILPMRAQAIAEVPVYKTYTLYNEALKDVCEQLDITYYEVSDLLTSDEAYERDGVHPKYAFYPLWLQRMVELAGL